MLHKIDINDFINSKGVRLPNFSLSYQIFGQSLQTAPIVMINHALTGNSNVAGDTGWWSDLVGEHRSIDTTRFTVLSFNIPGNGYGEKTPFMVDDFNALTAYDVASVFCKGLAFLGVKQLFALMGGSVGGAIAWEMIALQPNFVRYFIPIATDWKSTNWIKANCKIQDQILINSVNPVHDARVHAMTLYRTPASLKYKFPKTNNYYDEKNTVEAWLLHHGKELNARFSLSAYKLLNYILSSIDITRGQNNFESILAPFTGNILIISIKSDMFFTLEEDLETVARLRKLNKNITHYIIDSIHGHDAFLIEFKKLNACLQSIFTKGV
ncbi:alpha/beta fold hydrolase [Aquimarina sp. W85]|uniref:alpha/beta fold hydrolase n=1 Tax=Aquimarina rhodophyticola TaxID=3342246 RepID=UPI00366A6756